jgi:hypothetical protein
VIKESVEEITSWEADSMLKEEGKHHNFILIGCRKVFTGSTALSGRKWFTTSLRISLSSTTDD